MTDTPDSTRTIEAVVLEHLAADEAALRERVRDLEAAVVTYREMLLEALAAAHDLTRDLERLRERYHATLDENRRLRADLAPRAA